MTGFFRHVGLTNLELLNLDSCKIRDEGIENVKGNIKLFCKHICSNAYSLDSIAGYLYLLGVDVKGFLTLWNSLFLYPFRDVNGA